MDRITDKTALWKDIRFFKPDEFDSPDAPGSGLLCMNPHFVEVLDELRRRCGFPFVIHSGYRTVAHNKTVGGVDSSAHEMGVAADIRIRTSWERHAIQKAAYDVGFRRMGIADTFIHLDLDSTKAQDVTWLYPQP